MGIRSQLPTDAQYATFAPQRMGFFTWDLMTDKVYGDANLATLFDLDPEQVIEGVAIKTLVSRIAEKDRARVAKAISDSIVGGMQYQEQYRVQHRREGFVDVVAMGSCFRTADGIPSLYSGTVVDVTAGALSVGDDPLEIHCRSALEIARSRGNDLVARYLGSALTAMGK